jgi:hypothetical protein
LKLLDKNNFDTYFFFFQATCELFTLKKNFTSPPKTLHRGIFFANLFKKIVYMSDLPTGAYKNFACDVPFLCRQVQKLCTTSTFSLQTRAKTLHDFNFSLQTHTKTLRDSIFSLQTCAKTLHDFNFSLRTDTKTLHDCAKTLHGFSFSLQTRAKTLQASTFSLQTLYYRGPRASKSHIHPCKLRSASFMPTTRKYIPFDEKVNHDGTVDCVGRSGCSLRR